MNVDKLMKRIDLLKAGKILIMNHASYGRYEFTMNPQQNNLFAKAIDASAEAHEKSCRHTTTQGFTVTSNQSIEANPENFLLWGFGDWQVEIEPNKIEYVKVLTLGTYEDI